MSNPYYTFSPPAAMGDFIQPSNWNNEFADVQAGFQAVWNHYSALPNFAAGAYTVTFSIQPAAAPAHPVRYDQFLTWAQDINANGKKLLNLGSPTLAGDAVNFSTLQSFDSATRAWVVQTYFSGIEPSAVPLISFQADATKPGQFVTVNASGSAFEYRALPNITHIERAARRARINFLGA